MMKNEEENNSAKYDNNYGNNEENWKLFKILIDIWKNV